MWGGGGVTFDQQRMTQLVRGGTWLLGVWVPCIDTDLVIGLVTAATRCQQQEASKLPSSSTSAL